MESLMGNYFEGQENRRNKKNINKRSTQLNALHYETFGTLFCLFFAVTNSHDSMTERS